MSSAGNIPDDEEEHMEELMSMIDDLHVQYHKMKRLEEELFRFDDELGKRKNYYTRFVGPKYDKNLLGGLADCLGLEKVDEFCDSSLYRTFHAEMNESKKDDYLEWINEFLDLILVAIVIKISYQSKYEWKTDLQEQNFSALFRNIVDSFVMYLIVYSLFLTHTASYLNFTNVKHIAWYLNDDIWFFLHGLGLICIGIFIPNSNLMFFNARGLVFGYHVCLFALIGLHTTWYFCVQANGKRYCVVHIIAYTISFIVTLPAYFLEGHENASTRDAVIFGVSALIIFIVEVHSFSGSETLANGTHWDERFEILTMILIGETMISLVLLDTDESTNAHVELVLCIAFSYTIMYVIYMTYFLSNSRAVEGSTIPAIQLFFGYLLLAIGIFFKILVAGLTETLTSEARNASLQALTISIPVVQAMNWFLRIKHEDLDASQTWWIRCLVLIIPSGFNVALLYTDVSEITGLGCQAILSIFLFVCDIVMFRAECALFQKNALKEQQKFENIASGPDSLEIDPHIRSKKMDPIPKENTVEEEKIDVEDFVETN